MAVIAVGDFDDDQAVVNMIEQRLGKCKAADPQAEQIPKCVPAAAAAAAAAASDTAAAAAADAAADTAAEAVAATACQLMQVSLQATRPKTFLQEHLQ